MFFASIPVMYKPYKNPIYPYIAPMCLGVLEFELECTACLPSLIVELVVELVPPFGVDKGYFFLVCRGCSVTCGTPSLSFTSDSLAPSTW